MTMTTLNLHTDRWIIRIILVLLLLAGVSTKVFAGRDSTSVKYDSSSISLRQPDSQTQEDIYASDEWKYITEQPKPKGEKSFFDRLLDQLLKSLFEDVSESDLDPDGSALNSTNWWTIFIVIIGAALLVFFVLKATGTGSNLLFKGKTKRKQIVDASLDDVDIHAIDYTIEIEGAKSRKDYRYAVRLWFLRSLKSMTDGELITWKIDKTNSDYYYELSGSQLQKEFGSISLVFDYIWYGEFPVDEQKYHAIESDMRKFYDSINTITSTK